MASESIAHSASWAIDSEPVRARGIIVTYSAEWHLHISNLSCASKIAKFDMPY